MTFLDTYMNSSVYGDKFDELSYKIYMTIDGHNNFVKLPYECLTDCFIFKGVDEILLSWLIARLENEDTSAKLGERTIPEICLLRRKQHFGKEYRSEYFVIENAYYLIKDAKYSQISDIDEIIKSYTKVWYKIDMRYRYFNFYYDKLSNNTYFEKLRKLIENIYTNDYLNKITTNWCDCFSKSNGRTSLPLQSNFFYSYVEPKKERVCVIISDALRYEVARTLLEKFQADEKCTSSIKAMQSVLPSDNQVEMLYTALDMLKKTNEVNYQIITDYYFSSEKYSYGRLAIKYGVCKQTIYNRIQRSILYLRRTIIELSKNKTNDK